MVGLDAQPTLPDVDPLAWAVERAAFIHRGQVDKGGVPYIEHVLAVRELVRPYGPEAMMVALLHDSIEDFPGSGLHRGQHRSHIYSVCGPEVGTAVEALTKAKGEPYLDDYIERVAGNFLARVVKIADLTHNMDPRRIPAGQIVDQDFRRWDKYRKALIRLERGD